jgi:predicted nucleic acid-binding protein
VKTAILDTSFLIDAEREEEEGRLGPVSRTLAKHSGWRLFICPVTVAELMEGAEDPARARAMLATFRFQSMGWATAEKCAQMQASISSRLGENDAWIAAVAVASGHRLIGRDKGFSRHRSLDYFDHTKA